MKIIISEAHFINAEISSAIKDEVERIVPSNAQAFNADFGWRQTMKPGQLMDVVFTKNDLERMEQIIPKVQATGSYILDVNLDKTGYLFN